MSLLDILHIFSSSESARSADVRLRRIENKLDLVMQHLGLKYEPPEFYGMTAEARTLADAGQKIAAIKVYREETGAGLKEAKDAVEAYMAGRG
jgi:hypothetical protein